jgi:hypothetical protein
MRTEPTDGAHEPGNNRKKHGFHPRPKRGTPTGPIGFGSVLSDVKGPKGAGSGAGGADGESGGGGSRVTLPNGLDPAAFGAQLDLGAQAALSMGAVQTTEQVVSDDASGVRDSTEALREQDGSATHILQQQPVVPTALGRMSPSMVLSKVVDEATKQAIDLASRELHVELEPEDLGPLLVKLTRERDGSLDIRFSARQADAARILDAGSGLLRERLADAGFANAKISVEQDSELVLGGR